MKLRPALFACIGLFVCSVALAEQEVSLSSERAASADVRAPADATPAERHIEAANKQVHLNPKSPQALNDLALAYLRRARETADSNYLKEAEGAVTRGMTLNAANFLLAKTQVALLLAQQRYTEARTKAVLLNHRTPDDVMIYGYLSEAQIALGNYPEAEKAAQRMLNLLPNNVPGLMLAAKLRVLYGDPEGALDLLHLAYNETAPTEVEELAWIGNQMASIDIDSSHFDVANAILEQSDKVFPNYTYTAENLARVRIGQQRPAEAAVFLQKATQTDTNPAVWYELGKAETLAGQATDAHASYAKFERLATATGVRAENQNHDLILMQSDDAATAQLALKLAQSQSEVRHDVWTLDAYAWALYANGRYEEAESTIQRALAVGIQNPQISKHQASIAQKLPSREVTANTPRVPVNAPLLSHTINSAGSSVMGTSVPMEAAVREVSAPAKMPELAAVFTAFAPVPASLLTPHTTDTDRVIRNAQFRVGRNGKDAAGLANLGAAYLQRARESGNVDDYRLAEEATTQSLDLVSSDFAADAALTTMAEICMGEHRFKDAIDYSQKALALGSGDVSPFAIIGDAYADEGEYEKAKLSYARLTPPEMTLSARAAYARDSRLSYLEFIAGDTASAVALMKIAVAEGTAAQLSGENLAWLYYELGEYFTQAGDASSADNAYVSALNIHPGDYRALAALAKLRANLGLYTEAIELYHRAIAIVPMPMVVAELGDLYRKMGNPTKAAKQDQLVEYIAVLGAINQVLHNRDLAVFYADHDIKLSEALKLARKEFEVRHDVYTWDVLAWALYKNGQLDDAAKASAHALQFGTNDSLLLYHAGMIADKLGHGQKAYNDFTEALRINPHFHILYASTAQQRLALSPPQAKANTADDAHAPLPSR